MKFYDVIGLMSGTSLDGLDLAYTRFHFDAQWHFDLMKSATIAYNKNWQKRLKKANELYGIDLKKLDLEYGKWLGEHISSFIDNFQIKPDLIVSHGHTIFHQPEIGLTMQIGDGYQIFKYTGIKTVFDLRSMDVAFGGQGAPLVPIGDQLLFSEYDYCLNLGGFSNISFDLNDERIAFDACPANIVLNALSQRLGFEYDKNGELARSGHLNQNLLTLLNNIRYYQITPPKSLGLEWVEKNIFPLLKEANTPDLLNTFCHHIADQVAKTCLLNESCSSKKKMLITGGGAKNTFLIALIREKFSDKLHIEIPDEKIIDFKEAVIFALLGLLKDLGQINCLKTVTGASTNLSTGLVVQNPISE